MSTPTTPSFDQALEREKARPKRHGEGGRDTQLSQRLADDATNRNDFSTSKLPPQGTRRRTQPVKPPTGAAQK